MKTACYAILFVVLTGGILSAEEKNAPITYPGTLEGKSVHGYDQYAFEMDGIRGLIVAPKQVAADRPWIWRARFWGHEPQLETALLARGWHVVYVDVEALFGGPEAIARWDTGYKLMSGSVGLSKKPVLEGMSRGGLIIYNWAARNPEKVGAIYGDAPVCDFKSWPGGKGKGPGNQTWWQDCLRMYGLTEEEGLRYDKNPIDNLRPLADAGVPIIHVVGAADQAVPVEENTAILKDRYEKLGGKIEVISKPGVGHHPHSLKDPAPILEFFDRFRKK